MTDSPYILAGTSQNFDRLVIQNSHKGLVVVDFWAPWVGPSMRQREMLSELARAYEGRFLLVSVNTDEQKSLAQRFGVRSLPNLKLFRRGEMVAEYHGVQPEADYSRIIDQFVPKNLDLVSRQAVAAWQSGQAERALQILAEAAIEQPENLDYPALMGKILLREDRLEDACKLLDALPDEAKYDAEISRLWSHISLSLAARQADPIETLEHRLRDNPDDPETRFQLAASLLISDQLESGLEHLLYLAHNHTKFRDGIARKSMQTLLDMLGPEDERVSSYRRALYRLNY
ncbi:MAG: tetratricopeptide repeat protein [Chromatiales bacterium]|jgi:putative thioredoxin